MSRVPGDDRAAGARETTSVRPRQIPRSPDKGAIEPIVERVPRPPETQPEQRAEHHQHAGDREHVRVDWAEERLEQSGRPQDPQVLEGVSDPHPDEREQDPP